VPVEGRSFADIQGRMAGAPGTLVHLLFARAGARGWFPGTEAELWHYSVTLERADPRDTRHGAADFVPQTVLA
jgi:hypothetical protein